MTRQMRRRHAREKARADYMRHNPLVYGEGGRVTHLDRSAPRHGALTAPRPIRRALWLTLAAEPPKAWRVSGTSEG